MKISIEKIGDDHIQCCLNMIVFEMDGGYYTQKFFHYVEKTSEDFEILKEVVNDKNKALLNLKHEHMLIRHVCIAKLMDDLTVEGIKL